MTQRLALLIILGGLILCAGCSTSAIKSPTTTEHTDQLWLEHQAWMLKIENWQFSGKIGLRTPERASSASFHWRQLGAEFDINLSGPLGQGGAHLTGNANQMLIKISGQGEFESANPEQILQEQTGWKIPVATLLHWVRGIPSPDMKAEYQLDKQGRLISLKQSNWQLDYLSYHQLSSNWLPKKIKLHHDQTTLTLIIKQWDTTVSAS